VRPPEICAEVDFGAGIGGTGKEVVGFEELRGLDVPNAMLRPD